LVTFQQLRAALGSRLREELRYSHTRALASALALGDSRFLSSDDWLRLRQFALTHLFVISGLHLAVVAGLVWSASGASLRLAMLVGSVPQGWAILPLVITLLAATGYALLSGFSLPVRRALLMLVCALAPSLWGRPVLGTKALCFAATVILSFDPFAVLGSSFWMSFGAVALILWFNLWYVKTAIQGGFASAQTRWLSRLRSFVLLQAYLIVGMVPLSYFFFSSAAGLGSLANFLVVPMVTTVVVPLLLIAVALLPFSEFSTKLLLVPEYLLDKLWRALGYWSIHLPDLDSTVRPLSTSALIITSVLVLTWAARISKRQLPIALLLCAAVLLLRNRVPAPESRVTIFDVGQGLAALVEHENTRILIDTAGQFASGTPIAQQTFSNYLVERARIKHQDKPVLDLLIVSHEDLDHRGGEDFLRSRLHVKHTLRGEWADDTHSEVADAPVLIGGHLDLFRSLNPDLRQKPGKNQNQTSTDAELCRLGRTMRWPSGLSLRVLSNPANTGTRNDRSCVLLLTIQGYRFLFPGDIGSGVERALTAYWRDELKADVLIAGHHGSASSSSRLWLKWVEPRRFVVSAGYENAFGHPAAEVLDRVESSQATVLSTDERGAIVFDLSEEGDLRCRALRHRWAPTWRWAAQTDRC
ncbi:MAG: DNA internalization-related competence protein ComEC/Rec2, partial [Pseudomonadota bacterium]